MQHSEQVKQFNPSSFSGIAGGRLIAGLAILAVALTISGCSKHTHSTRTTRRTVVTTAYNGPYWGVQRVFSTGLYITIILVDGRTIYLPDDVYYHPDGYQIIISGGRVIALDGIPPGLLVASTRPGARRGRPFRGGRIAITEILFEGGKIIFVDGYGARISFPGGHFKGKRGHRLDFGGGHLRQVALNPAAPEQTKRPPKTRRPKEDGDRRSGRRGESDRRSDKSEKPERDRQAEDRDRRPEKRKSDASSNGDGRGNASSDRGNSDRGNTGSSNSADKKPEQPSGNNDAAKKEEKPASKSEDKKGKKSDKKKDKKKKDDKKKDGKKDEKKKPSDGDSPPR